MRLIYGTVVGTYGLFLLAATFAWRVIPVPFLRSEEATGISFAISAVLATPFVATYTKLGLNTAEGEQESPETKARHAALKKECPVWPIVWYGGIAFILLIWIGCAVVRLPAHPFFAFSGVLSSLTGLWFLTAYPVAIRLFKH